MLGWLMGRAGLDCITGCGGVVWWCGGGWRCGVGDGGAAMTAGRLCFVPIQRQAHPPAVNL